MRRFYAAPHNFAATKITLEAEETKHLRDVLRLSAGAEISVFDGAGKEFLCRVETIEKNAARLEIVREIAPKSSESNLDLTLGVALLKGEKFDLVVQKATELGVSKIIPLITKRADVKIRDANLKVVDAKDLVQKFKRWQRISIEAAKQSGRAKLPEIGAITNFDAFIKNSSANRIGGENLILFAEYSGEKFSAIKNTEKIVAAIGSEGGWDESEIDAAGKSGFQIVTLNGRILRAETAAIAVAAVLQHRFGDFN